MNNAVPLYYDSNGHSHAVGVYALMHTCVLLMLHHILTCHVSRAADPASFLQAIEQHVLSLWPSQRKDMGGPFMVSHVVGKCDPVSDRIKKGKP